jgi:hypothetical protein
MIDEKEDIWHRDGRLTRAMEGAFKRRGRKMLTTKEGEDLVHVALLQVALVAAARLEFDSLALSMASFGDSLVGTLGSSSDKALVTGLPWTHIANSSGLSPVVVGMLQIESLVVSSSIQMIF